MLKDQTVFNPTISACGKKHVLDHGVTFAVSDARHTAECLLLQRGDHWNIALKLKEAKEYDGDVTRSWITQ